MNKIITSLSILGISFLISNCTEEQYITEEYVPATQTVSLSGSVQKGPFVNGTSITISELDSALIQTGHTFFTQITNDKGSFEVDLELESDFVMLRADGFYFNEISGKTSTSQITLYALSDVTDSSTINVNILSHLEKPRVEFLISEGLTFVEAKKQAQSEVLSVFNIETDDIRSSELLDISQAGDDNAALLATSIILQGFRSEGELSELLSNISLDLREDGILDEEKLGTKLINHARLNVNTETRSNIEERYSDLGVEFEIGNFEKYVTSFVENTSFEYDNFITYPVEGKYGDNLLSDELVNFEFDGDYSFAAYLPIGTSLKVIVKPVQSGAESMNLFTGFGSSIGWEDDLSAWPSQRVFTAQGENAIVDLKINLSHGSATELFFHENGSSEPLKSKVIDF
ncbi:hypothetical protein [Reichenbachiella sp.]|uniref:hypothetical protein n=1 Tax=Reichenbachiella sp. TaxID=2184521 RepID=UPI003BB01879